MEHDDGAMWNLIDAKGEEFHEVKLNYFLGVFLILGIFIFLILLCNIILLWKGGWIHQAAYEDMGGVIFPVEELLVSY